MKKSAKKPVIRFSGFTNEWEQVKLGEIVNKFNNLRVQVEESLRVKGSTPYYGANGIQDYVKGYTHDGEFVLIARVGANDLLNYPVQYVSGKIWVSDAAHVLQGKENILNNKFFSYQINSIDMEQYIVGGTRSQLNATTLMDIELKIPSIQEQKLLGNLFYTIDILIALHQRKCERLQNIKKAILEKMFPKNNADKPQIRFKGYTYAWERQSLKELCSITTGKSNTQDQDSNGKYPFYIRSEIVAKSNKFLYDCEAVITIGDGNIGRVFHYVNGKFDLHQRCYKMADFNTVIGKYFYYFFSTKFYDRAMRMTAKATVDSVRLDMIADMEIAYPKEVTEQNKISLFLDKFEHLLAFHQRKCERLQNIKKAILEKMFC
ncbi:hypothetical protein MG1601_714 [Mycoplasmoides gallisepticum]